MRVKTAFAFTALAIAVFGLGGGSAFAQSEQFIPRLVYRTGPYAPNGIPFADGYADYLDMIDARDGGVGGVKITLRGVRNRLQQRQGRRVLRAAQE